MLPGVLAQHGILAASADSLDGLLAELRAAILANRDNRGFVEDDALVTRT